MGGREREKKIIVGIHQTSVDDNSERKTKKTASFFYFCLKTIGVNVVKKPVSATKTTGRLPLEQSSVDAERKTADDEDVQCALRLFQMTDILSLEQLVHLSLGDPEVGAVNFNVLKTLLLQMLKAMNLFNHKPTMSDDDQRRLKEALLTSTTDGAVHTDEHNRSAAENELERKKKTQRVKRDQSSDRLNLLEEKVFRFESQLNALDHIPSNSQLIDRAKQVPKKTSNHADHAKETSHHRGPILEVWQYTQMEKRIESAENGITRVDISPANLDHSGADV